MTDTIPTPELTREEKLIKAAFEILNEYHDGDTDRATEFGPECDKDVPKNDKDWERFATIVASRETQEDAGVQFGNFATKQAVRELVNTEVRPKWEAEAEHPPLRAAKPEAEEESGAEICATSVADLLPIPDLPGYVVDEYCRPWGTAKRGRKAGPLKPSIYFRHKNGQSWFIWRYKVTVDGRQRGFTAKYFAMARFFAEQRRNAGQPDVDTYEPSRS